MCVFLKIKMLSSWQGKRNRLQVNGFKSIYNQNIRLGYTKEESFADAIVATSDEKFRDIDPKLIEEYHARHRETKKIYGNRSRSRHGLGFLAER